MPMNNETTKTKRQSGKGVEEETTFFLGCVKHIGTLVCLVISWLFLQSRDSYLSLKKKKKLGLWVSVQICTKYFTETELTTLPYREENSQYCAAATNYLACGHLLCLFIVLPIQCSSVPSFSSKKRHWLVSTSSVGNDPNWNFQRWR